MSEYEDRSPQNCMEAGLTCEGCISASARELARTCQGLRGKMVAQLFVQLYPAPACSRMHTHFAAAYRAATAENRRDDWEDVPMAPPVRAEVRTPRVLVAVA
jgi:hypothetical protein